MPTAEQIKSLIRSHFGQEPERFYTMALQIAAHEARQGHIALAHGIREIIDEGRKKSNPRIINFPQELKGLVLTEEPKAILASMVMPKDLHERIKFVIHEYRQQEKLKLFGMSPRRKLLLIGPPGTGKTMTARALAKELGLPLHAIQVDRLVSKFMGETSAKLRQIFDLMQQYRGVYLFDEFDAIGGERSLDNDVGEMRRVLNSFLQFIEQDTSDSLVVAATNNPKLLDQALSRRFDDVLYYDIPVENLRKDLIANVLGTFIGKKIMWKDVLPASEGLSHAEIVQSCHDAIKRSILADKTTVSKEDLMGSLRNRQSARRGMGSDVHA